MPAEPPRFHAGPCITSAIRKPLRPSAYGVSERSKEFSSRNEAIAFAESNYWFVPLRIVHGKATLACWWEYVSTGKDSDDADSLLSLAKEVDCDAEEVLAQSYCDESGCNEHMTHHER